MKEQSQDDSIDFNTQPWIILKIAWVALVILCFAYMGFAEERLDCTKNDAGKITCETSTWLFKKRWFVKTYTGIQRVFEKADGRARIVYFDTGTQQLEAFSYQHYNHFLSQIQKGLHHLKHKGSRWDVYTLFLSESTFFTKVLFFVVSFTILVRMFWSKENDKPEHLETISPS